MEINKKEKVKEKEKGGKVEYKKEIERNMMKEIGKLKE